MSALEIAPFVLRSKEKRTADVDRLLKRLYDSLLVPNFAEEDLDEFDEIMGMLDEDTYDDGCPVVDTEKLSTLSSEKVDELATDFAKAAKEYAQLSEAEKQVRRKKEGKVSGCGHECWWEEGTVAFDKDLLASYRAEEPLPTCDLCPVELRYLVVLILGYKSAADRDAQRLDDAVIMSACMIEVYTCDMAAKPGSGTEKQCVANLGYFVTNNDFRGKGYGKLGINAAVDAIGPNIPLVLECHRTGIEDGFMDSRARLTVYEKLGFYMLYDLPYQMPALSDEEIPVNGYTFLIHKASLEACAVLPPNDSNAPALPTIERPWLLPSSYMVAFVLKYFSVCFTDERELHGLAGMLMWARQHEHITVIPPSKEDEYEALVSVSEPFRAFLRNPGLPYGKRPHHMRSEDEEEEEEEEEDDE